MAFNFKEKMNYVRENRRKTFFLDACIRISIVSYFMAFLLLAISAFTPQHSILRMTITAVAVIAVICGVLLAGYANCNGIDEPSFKEEHMVATEEELEELQQMIDDYKGNMNL